MLESPEFEDSFYVAQNDMMRSRYAKAFKKWKVSWSKYYKDAEKRLRGRPYWIWVFLVGFEKFLVENPSGASEKAIEDDKDQRISRIVGDFYKLERYVRGL